MRRAWVPVACLVAAAAAEVWLWRADWTTDTSAHAWLETLRVPSGQRLLLERSDNTPDQSIVDYQTPAGHSHRVRIYMKRARLSDQTRGAFTQVHLPAPKGDAALVLVPDPKLERSGGKQCQVHLIIGFAPTGSSPDRTVLLYPPQLGEASDSDGGRMIHLQSSSELSVRFSANSADGQRGPRCRSSLTMTQDQESWTNPLGMDWEWSFNAVPDSDILVIFAPDMWTGEGQMESKDELESLALQPTQPQRLAILPVAASRSITSRARRGDPVLTANSLQLGRNYLDVGLKGKLAIPIRESLADWQWASVFAAVDVPLVLWLLNALRKRERVFLSYSRADEARVMEINDMLEKAGGKPWIDRRNIPGGARWRALIESQMRRSKQVLVFLSEHSVKTGGYFWMEMEIAVRLAERRSGEAFVIPVKLENCQLPDVLMPYNALSLYEPGGQERLLEALGLPVSASAPASAQAQS